MEHILEISQTISPLGVIFILVVIIWNLIKGNNLISKIRGTQEQKYPELTKFMTSINNLTQQNESLLENHFKHEIPEIMGSQTRLETKLDKMNDTLIRIESKMK